MSSKTWALVLIGVAYMVYSKNSFENLSDAKMTGAVAGAAGAAGLWMLSR